MVKATKISPLASVMHTKYNLLFSNNADLHFHHVRFNS